MSNVPYPYPLPPHYYPAATVVAAVAVAVPVLDKPVFVPVPPVKPVVETKPDWPINPKTGRPVSRQAMWKQRKKEEHERKMEKSGGR